MLIWINFDNFAIKYRGCAYFFVKTKGPGTSFQVAVFVEFFDKFFSFVI